MMNPGTSVFLLYSGGRAVWMASNVMVTLLVGRLVGAAGLGQWTLLIGAAALLHSACINWTHASTVRFGSEEWASARTLRDTMSTRLPLLAVSVAIVLVLLVVQPGDWLQRVFGVDSSTWPLVAAYAVSLWMAAEAQAVLQATNLTGLHGAVSVVAAVAAALGVGISYWTAAGRVDALILWVAGLTGAVWGIALVYGLARARVAIRRPASQRVARHVRYAAPLLIGFVVGYISDWGDHVLLRTYTTMSHVGQFSVAYQVFLGVIAASGALATVLLPRLVAGHVAASGASRGFIEETIPTIFVVWALVSAIVVAVLPPLTLRAAGPQFRPAVDALAVLCVVMPAHTITSLYSVLFSVQERLGRMSAYVALMAGANLAVSILVIPRFGIMGAAAATALSYLIVEIAYVMDQHRYVDLSVARIVAIWITVVVLGLVQVRIVDDLGARLLWACITVAVVAWVARRAGVVNIHLLDRLFSGVLSPIAGVLRRALVA